MVITEEMKDLAVSRFSHKYDGILIFVEYAKGSYLPFDIFYIEKDDLNALGVGGDARKYVSKCTINKISNIETMSVEDFHILNSEPAQILKQVRLILNDFHNPNTDMRASDALIKIERLVGRSS